jgi:Myb-like DNA-binding domain
VTKSRGIRQPPKSWTREEDAILLENIEEMGYRKLALSGLLTGRSNEQIRNHYKLLRGVKNPGREKPKPMQTAPSFERRHASVWGYAAMAGSTE